MLSVVRVMDLALAEQRRVQLGTGAIINAILAHNRGLSVRGGCGLTVAPPQSRVQPPATGSALG